VQRETFTGMVEISEENLAEMLMRTTYRFAIPAICLSAALACYLVSFQTGVGLFFALGAAFEIVAWIMPLRRPNAPGAANSIRERMT
jgi:hypothetical protein